MPREHYINPLGVQAADPFAFRHKGMYYLYATHDPDTSSGLRVWTSEDLVHWRLRGFALERAATAWAQSRFWGGEVIHHNDAFYLFYTASPDRSGGPVLNMQVGLAKADSPLGPFKEVASPFLKGTGADEAIDQNVVMGPDGRLYFNWTRVTLGQNEVQCARLSEDLTRLDSTAVTLLEPHSPWERHPWEGHYVLEGSFLLRHKQWYYLLFTANHFRDARHAMGYAVGTHPLGPFERAPENPILQAAGRIVGVGNGSPVLSPDGNEWMFLYHAHARPGRVAPRQLALDRLRFTRQDGAPDRLEILGPTESPQPLPSGARPRRTSIREDFVDEMDWGLWTIINEAPGQWARKQGRLVLQLLAAAADAEWDDLRNLFMVETPGPDRPFVARAEVNLADSRPGDCARLFLHQNHQRHAFVELACTAQGLEFRSAMREDDAHHEVLRLDATAPAGELEITYSGRHAAFRARPHGGEWTDLGRIYVELELPRAGITAHGASPQPGRTAQFTLFHVEAAH